MIAHFSLGERSLHGPNHWKNVEIYGLRLCGLNGADETIIRLFAVLHDAERQNEGHDPQHGRRAADLARTLNGTSFRLDEQRMSLLIDALSYHNDGLTSEDITIGTCWDADRMDLPRVGIKPLARLMSTHYGKQYAIHGDNALTPPAL